MPSKRQERLRKQGLDGKNALARLVKQAVAVVRKERSGLAVVLVKDADDWSRDKVVSPDVGMVSHGCANADIAVALRFVVHYLVYQFLSQLDDEEIDDAAQRVRAEINVTIGNIVESLLAGD